MAPERKTNLNALLFIGSIRLFGMDLGFCKLHQKASDT
jgi:hypothetical protein